MVWRAEDPQGDEASKVRHLIVPYCQGRVLDLGAGPWKAWPSFMSVDNKSEWGGPGCGWTPNIFDDCTKLDLIAEGSCDAIFSSHLLEHIEDHVAALETWWRKIKVGGHLVLYLPHKDLYPNIGQEGANPDHKHDFLPEDIVNAMLGVAEKTGAGWVLRENETRSQGREYSFFQVFQKRGDGVTATELWQRNPEGKKRCLVVRFGAIGDMIIASSILPALKEQGWHVTWMTTPQGQEVLKHDPHIDEWWVQAKDFVPNPELGPYIAALAERFDKIINLNESLEATLLTIPGRANNTWSDEARRKILGRVNYLEFAHDIAGVPYEFNPRFYPTADELRKARKRVAEIGEGNPIVLWAMGGSAIHKKWPLVADVVAWLLERTPARIVLTGGPESVPVMVAVLQSLAKTKLGIPAEQSDEMEVGQLHSIVNEAYCGRNIKTKAPLIRLNLAPNLPLREVLSFAQLCDVVVGPETGLLNAVSFEERVRKVVFLSHSSPDNLTKHWRNTEALQPVGVSCWPCHRMHYDWTHCRQSKEMEGFAACAISIKPERVFEAIVAALRWRKAA